MTIDSIPDWAKSQALSTLSSGRSSLTPCPGTQATLSYLRYIEYNKYNYHLWMDISTRSLPYSTSLFWQKHFSA